MESRVATAEDGAAVGEGMGDSEEVGGCDEDVKSADEEAEEDDGKDAESCCGSDGEDVAADQRRYTWRDWLAEGDRNFQVGTSLSTENGGSAGEVTELREEAAAAVAEENRLFWEACLADGY